MNKNFILTGAAGYIAPRHLKAIKETGNNLLAVTDPHDSVGILDSYFPNVAYFREFERFDRHVDKLLRNGTKIDYLTVCSPNYIHDAHVRFGLRIGANVICEKPLVIKPDNCNGLIEMEREKGRKVNTILQMRLHPKVQELKKLVDGSKDMHSVDLTYVTPRGSWYLNSWKGDEQKSGGLLMNIGIHFFDILLCIFGPAKGVRIFDRSPTIVRGELDLEKATVCWLLSIDNANLPEAFKENRTCRLFKIDNKEMEFSDGFRNLHTKSYEEILAGRGFGIEDCYPSIQLVDDIRKASVMP